MERSAIFAGFGGQGVLLLGKVVASAALAEGREVSWLPSYGPEMRGGTANCTVVVSDRPIGSPVVRSPDVAVVMNIPSCERFAPLVRPGGLLLVNSTLIARANVPERSDIEIAHIPVTGIAIELEAPIVANMVMLGAFAALAGFASLGAVEKEVDQLFAAKKAKALAVNRRAIARGVRAARAAPCHARLRKPLGGAGRRSEALHA